jgi:chromosome segregation ATPase
MKLIFLHCLLVAAPIVCFSQQLVKDTVKERNDLIALRGTLAQESASLQTEIDHEQALIDSISKKLAMDSADLEKIKATDPEGHKAYIKNSEKKLQHFREQRDQLTKKLSMSKAELKQAADLLKDLDAQIKELQNRPG